MKRRILILGGARFHGLQLAEFLSSNKNEVYVLNRGIYKTTYNHGIKHLIADRNKAAELECVLKNSYFDAVIDNNAYNQYQVELLLDLLQNKCSHYIFTSTVAVYLNFSSRGKLKEKEAEGRGSGLYPPQIMPYALEKLAAENSVRKKCGDVNFTILRFPNIFGEGDFKGKLAYFYYRLLDGGKVLLEKEIKRFNIIYVKDAIRIFNAVVENSACYAETLNICDPQAYSYDKFLKTVYKKNYSPKKLFLMDAAKLWKKGFYLPFAWGPILDTSLARKLLGNITFSPLEEWSSPALDWEIRHFRDLYQGKDYACSRKFELELISKYGNG